MKFSFNIEDASQLIIGAFVLAVPISFSEESWRLGETLPTENVFLIFAISILFLSIFTYGSIFQGNIKNRVLDFVIRIIIAYLITIFVVSIVLLAIEKLPLISDTAIAIKRLVVIAMPASIGGIVVDSFDKE
jgi:uncharacterized membrane protein